MSLERESSAHAQKVCGSWDLAPRAAWNPLKDLKTKGEGQICVLEKPLKLQCREQEWKHPGWAVLAVVWGSADKQKWQILEVFRQYKTCLRNEIWQ